MFTFPQYLELATRRTKSRWDWWIPLIVLLGALYLVPKCQQAAAAGVLKASIEDPNIYQIAYDNGLFLIEE